MNILEKTRHTFELVDQYASHLAEHYLNQTAINVELSGFRFENTLKWENRENLDSGTSGVILFLIEYYKKTKNAQYLIVIDQYIADLLKYCNNHSTHNYSLYTGRGSVIYILIQRYQIDENKSFLNDALNLIVPAKNEFLNSEYTSDYLYDGRAGTLLLICELYRVTQSAFLLDYINQFLFRILSNMKFSVHGAFWSSEEEINLNPSCGFAYGAAGIRYVLHHLNQHTKLPILKSVIDRIDEFINFCWTEEIGNWADFRKDILDEKTLTQYKASYLNDDPDLFLPKDDCSWANGTIGILFSFFDETFEYSTLIKEKLRKAVLLGNVKSDYLKDGLAGLGIYFLQEINAINPDLKEEIINELTNKLSSKPFEIQLKGGLLNGNLGAVYFLLKAVDDTAGSENILRPFYGHDLKVDFTLEFSDLRRNILQKYYPRTISLLETTEPMVFFEYLEALGQEDLTGELKRFKDFMKSIHQLEMEALTKALLSDIFKLETQRIDFFEQNKDSCFKMYIEDFLHHEHALRYFKEPKEWLMNQVLVISDKIKILNTEWSWRFDSNPQRMKKEHMLNFGLSPGKFEYIIQLAGKLEIKEFLQSEDKVILLHQFDHPKPVREAIAATKTYMETPEGKLMVEFLFKTFDDQETNDFFDNFDDIILYKIREWIYNGVLIIKD